MLAAVVAALVLGVSACADLPEPAAVDVAETGGPVGVVTDAQADLVRADVAARLERARDSRAPEDARTAATGPALAVELLRQQVDGSSAAEEPSEPSEPSEPADLSDAVPSPGTDVPLAPDSLLPAGLVVSPQLEGWPRWFATVVVPEGNGSGGEDGQTVEAPTLEVYTSAAPREPYLLWGRATLLPGAEVPAFPAAEVGTPAVEVVPAESYPLAPPEDEEDGTGAEEAADPAAPDAVDPDLRLALEGVLPGYVSVLRSGNTSPAAAAFEPDPFVPALRDRAAAEREAVADVASVTVGADPFRSAEGGGEDGAGTGDGSGAGTLLAARTLDGDVLAVTAVQTTTTTTARPGTGTVRPGPQVQAAAGIEATDGTLTVRSVAVLVFLVPAERGAVRLVAVGEELVGAEAR